MDIIMWDWSGTLSTNNQPTKYAEDCLQRWKVMHIIISNGLKHEIARRVDNFGWKGYFSGIFGRERYMKPDPRAITEALKDCNTLPSNALMIGDQISDIQCARLAGCRYILIGPNTSLKMLSTLAKEDLFKHAASVL